MQSEHRRQILAQFASISLLNAILPLTATAAEVDSEIKRRDLSIDQLLEIIQVPIDYQAEAIFALQSDMKGIYCICCIEAQLWRRGTSQMVNTTSLGS